MIPDSSNPPDRKPPQGPWPSFSGVPTRLAVRAPKPNRPQMFTKVFRWQRTADRAQEPATVEVAGTFTQWQKVPLSYDDTQRAWHVTLHDLPVNRTHHYMLLVDGRPVRDEHCDGLATPRTAQETQYALKTERGPRVLMLFGQTK